MTKCRRETAHGRRAKRAAFNAAGQSVRSRKAKNERKIYMKNNFTWKENVNGGITITDYTGNGGEVVIPSKIDGKSVTSIRG